MLQTTLIPALVTPFQANGQLDLPAFRTLAGHLIKEGCDGLLVNGTTGECPTLSLDEKLALIQTAQAVIGEQPIPLMSGAGSNNTQKSVEEAKAMAALGVKALLIVVPYYNKPSQAGLRAHFTAVAQAVPEVQIVIYNIPGRCGVLMSADTMAQLHATCPNIIGVKQSHPDMDAVTEITQKLPANTWRTWCGDDSLTLPMMALGACGVVSVAAHVVANPLRRMIDAFKGGDQAAALSIHHQLFDLLRELFFLPNPTVVKTLLAELGYCHLSFREPMLSPDAVEMDRIMALKARYESVFVKGLLLPSV